MKWLLNALLPAPLLSAALFILWLLLNRSASPGQLILAAILALAIPVLTRGLRPLPVRIRRPGMVLRLGLTVMADTVESNLAVVRFLLLPRLRRHPPAFVHIPLELRDPNALAVLAMIVCITPGTAWAELARDRSALMLHVLEVGDPQAIIDHVKTRYERPLMEIFE
ncbi:Na+/H+ antiporter subunit E [Simplicispira lacusdiani]|uniref:Na+/H+ antiporter subunit E n=1 Tax=Simplicispira lacusdiani TaxID=2213010 RepID=UPI000E7690FC|nr:Na+/H+ antiporter subunit E [Simplicispira lacusdiani]